MTATLYLTKASKDFPFTLLWESSGVTTTFDSIIASYVGANTGTQTQYRGSVPAWMEYTQPETGKSGFVTTWLELIFGDSSNMSQLVIQFKMNLAKPITVKPGTNLILHLATPLGGRVPVENASFASSAWSVNYGLRGTFN